MFWSTLCQLMEQLRHQTGNFFCRKYRFIPQTYNENKNNMAYGDGYLWFWSVYFCGVCRGWVGVEAKT